MWPFHPEAKAGTYPKLPLLENGRVIDAEITPAKMDQLTTRYTERAVSFIERNKDRPFFFYLAHAMPHHVWTARPDGQIDWCNEQTYRYCGLSADA
eukprot:gene59577-biopygen42994